MQADTLRSVIWRDDHVAILDQTQLPQREDYIACKTVDDVARAIRSLSVRGAPAIGIAAAMAIALAAHTTASHDHAARMIELRKAADSIRSTRPTAVNLRWALDRMLACADRHASLPAVDFRQALLKEALGIQHDDLCGNRELGGFGQEFISQKAVIMTICNTGSLATGGHGTALGVVRSAVQKGKSVSVVVCETRPLLQGARLTVWELQRDRIPATLITDNMAAWYMKSQTVDCVIAGADRIAANGDTANKIGTYGLAVLARAHKIPFLIAAPHTTFDPMISDGSGIPIEQRDPAEVLTIAGIPIAPHGAAVWNPAFDIVPSEYIHAFITDRGVFRPPFEDTLRVLSA